MNNIKYHYIEKSGDFFADGQDETDNFRKRILEDDYIMLNISKEMMFDYSIDPYGGD